MHLALAILVLMTLQPLTVFSQNQAAAKQGGAELTEEQRILYALGAMLGRNVGAFNLSSSEVKYVTMGLEDFVQGKPLKADPGTYAAKVNDLAQKRSAERAQREKEKSKTFLDQAAKEKGVQRLSSGLLYKEILAGKGPSPKPTDTVKVHYEGRLIDGTVFDSSLKRGTPAEFALNAVIPCWTEGVQKMKVAGKAKLICPSSIAYGDRGSPPTIPGGATLIFEVELLDIVKK